MQLSVVICTYNYAHFLKHALRAVAAQTFADFELVIVDDGSTDETEEVVKAFSIRFPNCVYLKKNHSGLADSRNAGVRAAGGTHVAFLDADDLWSPEYLNVVQTIFAGERNAELVVSDGVRVHGSGQVKSSLFPAGLPPVCGPIHTARQLFSWFPFAAPSATIFSKRLYERVGDFDPKLPNGAEDWHWFIRAAKADAFCVRLDQKLVIYRHHDANLTSRYWEEMFLGWLTIYSELLKNETWTSGDARWYARRLTHKRVLRMMARYRPENARLLLNRTSEVFGEDMFFRITRGLTYLGLCRVASCGAAVKRILTRMRNPTILNLDGISETIFE